MKYIFILFTLFSFTNCATSQGYSTDNKKAIKYFELALKAPRESKIEGTNTPNFPAGLEILKKALDKEPNFWEAHVLAGEFEENMNNYESAIDHYKKALAINPNHTRTGSTYFYLGNLQHATGDYDNAIRNLDLFMNNRSASPELQAVASQTRRNCIFARDAILNPLPFDPINAGPGINTAQPEYFPTITVDGKTILFTRRIKDGRVRQSFKEQEDFFVSQLIQDQWATAVPMPTNVNTVNNEGAPTISADGRTLVFVGCPDVTGEYGVNRNGRGSCDLFITHRLGAKWTNPENLPGMLNSMHWETQPSLSSDGKTMYFIRGLRGRNGSNDSDIYVSYKDENDNWGNPIRLPDHINTKEKEESVLIHPDGKTLYFASRGHIGMGGSDLYVTRMDEQGNWSMPKNLGYPINTKYDENSLMVSPEGEVAFFASNRDGGYGDLDIYYFTMPESMRPTKTLYFEGLVYDIKTREPLPGKFQLIDLATGKEVMSAKADPVTGEFVVPLPVNKEYALNVQYPGYAFFTQNFDMENPDNLEAIHLDVPMVPLNGENSEGIPLANVFFDVNKATLRPKSFVELNKLVEFMMTYPKVKIEIGGHTDVRGSNNLVLSQNRAKAVYSYLISKEVPAERMTYKGYGSTVPIITMAEIELLSTDKAKEKAHQANRRTEYKILAE
ncbi:MAG: outer membrane protein OmpA-like peptidoglycan-associated protein [Crocinitomicaceae bacterium]|jgi:outer membrane protein OmpA-like peptidoglycan-associated protein